MKKKILIVDDSALMRRVMCDIINSDERFQVVEQAFDGEAAYELLKKNQYDGVVLDVNMPKINGIQLLRILQKDKIRARIMMASTDTKEGASVTMEALDLGAIDFIEKPANIVYLKGNEFKDKFLETLQAVVSSRQTNIQAASAVPWTKQDENTQKLVNIVRKSKPVVGGQKVVALACSTGGPKALQSVIPRLPAELAAPVLIVQHMPKGFTQSLAERLNSLSKIKVKEAAEGDVLENGVAYISMGGKHMNVVTRGGKPTITYTDEPPREGVKPCANYMYESLKTSSYSQIICVVLTGMGADGTKGIVNLGTSKKIHVIAQDEATSTVYGMPKAIAASGLVDQVVPLDDVAQEIIMNVGVK
ncbi:MAG: chemotaxis-specific protein-glutamate methyltransferase CheB [Lachnospiraceae bacterium]|nr:chemotaxis-specific protein-glutamate methyltransferase CheB [Lachnospiraceae bacterium]MBO5145791.1 chemotaxis-specific protein-glutamate methyltransferase CheB [Lachnospiraceae bacterium]